LALAINDAALSTTASRKSGENQSWDYLQVRSDDPAKLSRNNGTDFSTNMLMEKITSYYKEKLIGGFSLIEFATALVANPTLREKVVLGQ